ncbi:uncharacterized protein LOC122256202 [Penaeus japonicus]|uniref:uncharacterized protein LOC122256202 n=1 Tax=Penaeus japonicus TaxID=27405 RepID=UPI001C710B46|nr:uncharacterized protein LOC122256202 [Penaeus japonicus]
MDGRDQVECCGCMSLREGTITIGVLYLVFSLIFEGLLIYVVCHDDLRDYRVMAIVLLVIVSISTIALILLLFGAGKNRHGFILPWIIWESICVGLGVVGCIVSVFTVGASALTSILSLGIRIYFLYVVVEFRKKLMAQEVNSQAMC